MPHFGDIASNPSLGGKILLGGDILLGGQNNNMMLIGAVVAVIIVGLVVYFMYFRNEEGMATGIQQSGGPSLGNYGYKEWDNDNVHTAEACGSPGGRINQRGCDNDYRQLAIAEARAGQHGTPEGFDYAAAIRGIPSENFADFPPDQLLLTPLESFADFEHTFDTTTFGNAPSIWPGVYEGMDNSGSMHSRNSNPFATYKRYQEIEGLRRLNYPDASRVTGAAVRGQLVEKVAPKALAPKSENMADLPVFNVGMAGFSAEAFSPTRKYGYMKTPKRSEGFANSGLVSKRAGWGSGQPTNPFVGDSGAGAFVPFSIRNYLAGDVSMNQKKKLGEKYTNVGLGSNPYFRRKGHYASADGSIIGNVPFSSNRAQFLRDWVGDSPISSADVINATFGSAELMNSLSQLSTQELNQLSLLADQYTFEELHAPVIVKALKAKRSLSRKGNMCVGKTNAKDELRAMLKDIESYDSYTNDAVMTEIIRLVKNGLQAKGDQMCLNVNFTQQDKNRLAKLSKFANNKKVIADLAIYRSIMSKAAANTAQQVNLVPGFTPFNACRVKAGRARWDANTGRRIRYGIFTPKDSCDYSDFHASGKGARLASMPLQCRPHLNEMVMAKLMTDPLASENKYKEAYQKMCSCMAKITGKDYCN